MKRAVFLDRDGVLNRAIVRDGKPYPPANLSELEILPGVGEALAALHAAGFLLIVVTNQPDVARGTTTREAVQEINAALGAALPIDEFRTCFHDNEFACECRKPKPGALLAAAALHNIDLRESYMVGDRWRDTEAGQRAGCKTILIDYGYQEKQPEHVDHRVKSLLDAIQFMVRKTE
jgi:D-glycero-D-manno-heptose 1,7-bisphosphate phosphatase